MAQVKLNTHISNSYNRELENLRNSVLTMGGVIEQQLQDTLDALQNNNLALAEKVVLNDPKVNSMEIQIDEECMRIIAKRHPTASDLRLVLTIAKATTDIERMGDEISRIASLIARQKAPDSSELKSSMLAIGNLVLEMLKGSLNAFARMDFEAALSLHRQDDEIDNHYKKLLGSTVLEMQENKDDLGNWLEVLWALRSFERLGDRCKNICEFVIYLSKGKDIRHFSIESIKASLTN